MRVGRRALLAGAATVAIGCSRREAPVDPVAPAPTRAPPAPPVPDADVRGATKLVTLDFDPSSISPTTVAIVPTWGGAGARFPVVVALHGRGEALKGPALGAMGWPRDYALVHAIERICAPPVTPADLEFFVDDARLAKLNRDLLARPFGGLVVVCPYVPDIDLRSDGPARAYGRFILGELLPRVRRELPVLSSPESTGIDGISMGGATALRVGLYNPESFGAVGALQAAIFEDQAQEWAELAKAALAKKPGLKLRLLTSDRDGFRAANTRASEAWRAAAVAHEFVDIPGPHDYPFNRGPGSYELLAWHDRALER
jgi:hypothetical protein